MDLIKIKVKIGSVEVELSQKEMIGLRDALNELTGHVYPVVSPIVIEPYQRWRDWWYCTTTGNTATIECKGEA